MRLILALFHTAHISSAGLIRYRYHPLCGREVRVIRRCHGLCSEEVIVGSPDQTRCALPGWMLDEAVCKSLTEAEHPVVSVTALCGLGELLDAQVPLVSRSPDQCELTPKEKTTTQGKRGLQPLLPLTSTDNAARCLELLAQLLKSVVVSDPTCICENEY